MPPIHSVCMTSSDDLDSVIANWRRTKPANAIKSLISIRLTEAAPASQPLSERLSITLPRRRQRRGIRWTRPHLSRGHFSTVGIVACRAAS